MQLQVGVKAFIKNASGKYLLLKRAIVFTDEKESHWDIPGGRINPGEPLYEGLAREIKEETGLVMKGDPKILIAQDILRPERELHVVRLTFTVSATGKVAIDSKEHADFQWVTMKELKKLNHDLYLTPVLKLLA